MPLRDAERSAVIANELDQRRLNKVILRLVKGGAERRALAAGEVDAVIDPRSGEAILLPQARQFLCDLRASSAAASQPLQSWSWEQDTRHRFLHLILTTSASDPRISEADFIGATLWDLGCETLGEVDWDTHRQQRAWCAAFSGFELRYRTREGQWCELSLSGEPVFDEQGDCRGYRGEMREQVSRSEHAPPFLISPR